MNYNKNSGNGVKDDILNLTQQMKIYLQKDEAIFERYGDEEAELYEQMQQMEREMAKNQPQKSKGDRRDGKQGGGGYNQEATKQDAEKLGFNFSKGGPPRFKNDKKKDHVDDNARTIVDKS